MVFGLLSTYLRYISVDTSSLEFDFVLSEFTEVFLIVYIGIMSIKLRFRASVMQSLLV